MITVSSEARTEYSRTSVTLPQSHALDHGCERSIGGIYKKRSKTWKTRNPKSMKGPWVWIKPAQIATQWEEIGAHAVTPRPWQPHRDSHKPFDLCIILLNNKTNQIFLGCLSTTNCKAGTRPVYMSRRAPFRKGLHRDVWSNKLQRNASTNHDKRIISKILRSEYNMDQETPCSW